MGFVVSKGTENLLVAMNSGPDFHHQRKAEAHPLGNSWTQWPPLEESMSESCTAVQYIPKNDPLDSAVSVILFVSVILAR